MVFSLEQSWQSHKMSMTAALAVCAFAIVALIIIDGVMVGMRDLTEPDLQFALVSSTMSVLLAYLVLLAICWGGPSRAPAIYDTGVLLVRPDPLRLRMSEEYVAYGDLEVELRTTAGLRVRSRVDGQSWFLPKTVFGDSGLAIVSARVMTPPAGARPPELVVYPRPVFSEGQGDDQSHHAR
jgi:hypothetical protein